MQLRYTGSTFEAYLCTHLDKKPRVLGVKSTKVGVRSRKLPVAKLAEVPGDCRRVLPDAEQKIPRGNTLQTSDGIYYYFNTCSISLTQTAKLHADLHIRMRFESEGQTRCDAHEHESPSESPTFDPTRQMVAFERNNEQTHNRGADRRE